MVLIFLWLAGPRSRQLLKFLLFLLCLLLGHQIPILNGRNICLGVFKGERSLTRIHPMEAFCGTVNYIPVFAIRSEQRYKQARHAEERTERRRKRRKDWSLDQKTVFQEIRRNRENLAQMPPAAASVHPKVHRGFFFSNRFDSKTRLNAYSSYLLLLLLLGRRSEQERDNSSRDDRPPWSSSLSLAIVSDRVCSDEDRLFLPRDVSYCTRYLHNDNLQ